MLIKFTTNFANNWKRGDIVTAEPLGNGDVLVDGVAAIDAKMLASHCDVIDEEEE